MKLNVKDKTLQEIFMQISKNKGVAFVNYTGFRRVEYSYNSFVQSCYQMISLLDKNKIKKGDKISFIKILNKPGVKPVELAKKEEIDSKKYMEFMESTLEQITSSMDLDFDTMLGKPKQTGLDEFFWS